MITDEIREILVKRVDQQKQATGIVAGLIEPKGRRVIAYPISNAPITVAVTGNRNTRWTAASVLRRTFNVIHDGDADGRYGGLQLQA